VVAFSIGPTAAERDRHNASPQGSTAGERSFEVSSFWLEIAILGQNLILLGVNMGQMLKLNILTPKKNTLA